MGWVTARWILSREPEPGWIEAFMQGRDDSPWQAFVTGGLGPEVKGDRIIWTFPAKDKNGAAYFLTAAVPYANSQHS